MNIPVMDNGKVVAVAGVGNKPGKYSEEDVLNLTVLMQSVWRIFQKKVQEEEIIRQNKVLQLQERNLKENYLKLQEYNKQKDLFLATMSHELRTPLNAVIGFSQALNAEYFGTLNEKQREYVTDIFQSAEHLLSLINDILDVATIDAGKIDLNITLIDVREIVEEVLVISQTQLLLKKLRIEHFVDSKVSTIDVDKRRFKQILINLISNAIKYSVENSKIDLEIYAEGDSYIRVIVADEGVGIKKEEQKKIFSEFYQADATRDNAMGGTGIGLALCKRLVEKHKGEIGVKSDYGRGATFWFTLPVKQ